ncbi:MAG TPA: VOC family protein [Verrucomicrobiae bacterium]|nr:VOC family protein [Verrucomicrobiae bacterium]
MQKVKTYLWFEKDAEAAMNFYVEIFNGAPEKKAESKVVSLSRYPEGPLEGPMVGLEGKVANGAFMLAGNEFIAFDGGPQFKFNEAISLFVDCDTQKEVDYYWEKLSAVPEAEACGWLKDKFGLSWQIVPKALGQLMSDPDAEKAGRVMQAMLQMKKLDIAQLQAAHDDK